MAKRFIDTDLFRKPFMRGLEAPYKALWIYLLCECDHAGIWVVELDVAQIRMGMKLDPAKAIEKMQGSVVEIHGGAKWYLPDFVEFQYGALNAANRVHFSVLEKLKAEGIDPENKPLTSPLQGDKDKDKEKEKDKAKDKEQVKEKYTREPEVEIIPAGVSVELHEAIKRWEQYRKEKRNTLTPSGREAFTKKCAEWGDARAIAAIDHSIAQGWTGCFEPKTNTNGPITEDARQERRRLVVEANAKFYRERDAANGDQS